MELGDLITPTLIPNWPVAATYLWQDHPPENPGNLETFQLDKTSTYLLIEIRYVLNENWSWIRLLTPMGMTGWMMIQNSD